MKNRYRFLLFTVSIFICIGITYVILHHVYDEYTEQKNNLVSASTLFDIVQHNLKTNTITTCAYPEHAPCDKSAVLKLSINVNDVRPDEFKKIELLNGAIAVCKTWDGFLYCIEEPQADESFYELLKIIFYLISGSIVFGFSFYVFSDIRRLYQLANQPFEKIRLPDFHLSKKSFLYPLSSSLQDMKSKIEELSRFQVEFIETVCHDIKTPVAKIKFQLEMPDMEHLQSTKRIKRYTQEIEQFLDDFLQLSAHDYTQRRLRLAKVNVQQQLQKQLADFQELTTHQLQLCCPEHLQLQFDPLLIQRAVNNLISNALRFCHSKVQVSVQTTPEHCWVSVDDDGNSEGGAQPSEYQSLMQAHHGMGLEIVRRIAKAHGGELQIGKSSLGGYCVRFSIRLDI